MFDVTTYELIGYKYSVFVETKDYSLFPNIVHDYKDIYEILDFSKNTVQRALWRTADWNENDVDGKVIIPLTDHNWTYSFSKGKLTIEESGGTKSYGTKSGNTITIFGKNYIKQPL